MPTQHYGPDTIRELQRIEVQEIAWNNQQAGVGLSQYDIVYSDGQFWKKAAANNPLTVPDIGLGMAQDAAVSGGTVDVWFKARITNSAWAFVSGTRVFLGSGASTTSGGAIVSGPPVGSGDMSVVVGWAVTPTKIEFASLTPVQLGT